MTTLRSDQKGNRPEKKPIASGKLASWLAGVAAWVWAIVAGGGGLLLLLTRGPLPLTNGWFALFSGIPPTTNGDLVGEVCGYLSGRVRITSAILFFIAGENGLGSSKPLALVIKVVSVIRDRLPVGSDRNIYRIESNRECQAAIPTGEGLVL
jgi:hypothetical protein